MYGDNPIRPPEKGDGSVLFVKNIFRTIQGEGPNVGMPAVFIRLGGCNLACSFCDTEFEDYDEMGVDEVISSMSSSGASSMSSSGPDPRIHTQAQGVLEHGFQTRGPGMTPKEHRDDKEEHRDDISLIVITGGEPFRQPIGLLCQKLIDLGYKVQIETNGTLYREVPEEVEIICSPKASRGKYLSIEPRLLPRLTALKYLISSNIKDYDNVPELGQSKHNIPVFVQPMDEYDAEINLRNKKKAVEIAMNNSYRLSYQIHKELGIE